MTLSLKAERAYGPDFVPRARMVAAAIGVPLDWLLAIMCWETTQFSAKGPPWPVNKGDGGGGLIGFTPLKTHPANSVGPVDQLPYVESYYRGWMTKLKVARFQTPEDLYIIVRGPYGIGKPDSFPMGGGLTKGDVDRIYGNFLKSEGVVSPPKVATAAAAVDAKGAAAAFVPRVGPAKTTGSDIRVRSGPGLTHSTVRFLAMRGTRIDVLGQVRGDNVSGNDLWDRIADGYVSDKFVSFE